MNKMPYRIKQKLEQLGKTYEKAQRLSNEVSELFGEYDFEIDYITGCMNDGKPQNEAYAYICNAEGNIPSSIKEIEEVFLWHINNN